MKENSRGRGGGKEFRPHPLSCHPTGWQRTTNDAIKAPTAPSQAQLFVCTFDLFKNNITRSTVKHIHNLQRFLTTLQLYQKTSRSALKMDGLLQRRNDATAPLLVKLDNVLSNDRKI